MHSGLVQGATLGREPLCLPGEAPPCIVSMCVALPYASSAPCCLGYVTFSLQAQLKAQVSCGVAGAAWKVTAAVPLEKVPRILRV
jgi:hypothetical protein